MLSGTPGTICTWQVAAEPRGHQSRDRRALTNRAMVFWARSRRVPADAYRVTVAKLGRATSIQPKSWLPRCSG